MNIERTHGIVDGEAVYHLVAYADDKLLIALRMYPSQPVRWFAGNPSKADVAEVKATLKEKRHGH